MNLNISLCASLPKMAWLLVQQGSDVRAFCGEKVTIADNGLFEGGWSGAKDWRPWSESALYFGSGFYIQGDRLTLIAASHTCESIYVLRVSDQIFASNSLAFLVAFSNSKIRLSDFSRRLWSLTKGVADYDRVLYLSQDETLNRYLSCSITIRSDGKVEEIPTKASAPARTFYDYKEFLLTVVSDVRDSSGFQKLAGYLSKGYDSVACAALIKELGGGSAISITKSRYGVDDSGEEIAAVLGLRSELVERPERETYAGGSNGRNVFERFTEEDVRERYEFYVGLNMADECLKVDDSLLGGSVVLTGFHGDKVWDVNQPANSVVARGDSTGSSLYEFRLRAGFVHVPIPLVGALSHPELLALGLSQEMTPWRLGNRYDRPIARRLGEEAGVPREWFGQKKQAAATMTELGSGERTAMFQQLVDRYAGVSGHGTNPESLST